MNRLTLRALLAPACAALCATLLAACGGSGDTSDAAAARILSQTFAATAKLRDAHLTASIQLDPQGVLAAGGPITLRAAGPFALGATGRPSRYQLDLTGLIAKQQLSATATSTGDAAFLGIDGRDYAIDKAYLARTLASHGSVAALGLNPRAWIRKPKLQDDETVGGVPTKHLAGKVAFRVLLVDLDALFGAPNPTAGPLTPTLRDEIADVVTSTRVDVWTGVKDKIMREMAVAISFAYYKDQAHPIPGLDSGRILMIFRLDAINTTTVAPVAPADARPLSELAGTSRFAALLSGLGAGIFAGTGTGNGGETFQRCLAAVAGKTAAALRCAAALAPHT